MGAVQRQKGAVHPLSKWGMCADTVRTQKPRVPGAAAMTGAVLDKTLASNTHPLKRLLERDQLFSRSGCLGLATLYCALFDLTDGTTLLCAAIKSHAYRVEAVEILAQNIYGPCSSL